MIAGETQVGNLNGTETPLAKAKKNRKKKSKKSRSKKQSSPPRVPLTDVFPSGKYPEGELQGYKPLFEIRPRKEPAEIRYDDRRHWNDESFLQTYRKAAEVHRQARKWIPSFAKPGKTLLEIAEGVEDSVRALLNNAGLGAGNGLKSGLAFPTGLCVNHQVAHYTPYPGQKPVILQPEDVLTVDFGVHIEGWIVDSAFTVAFEPTYDSLLAAVRDSTNTGIEVDWQQLRNDLDTNNPLVCRCRRPYQRRQWSDPRDDGKLRGRSQWPHPANQAHQKPIWS